MKVMFLDIDGVIATTSCYGAPRSNKWVIYKFDEKCVIALNFILQETGAEIIISSDWKNRYTLQEIREIFAHNFVIKSPIGFTPSSESYDINNLEINRTEEIKAWLKHNAWKNDIKWVAIDDLNLSEGLGENFVLCKNEHEGIKRKGVKEKIIEILNT